MCQTSFISQDREAVVMPFEWMRLSSYPGTIGALRLNRDESSRAIRRISGASAPEARELVAQKDDVAVSLGVAAVFKCS